MNNHRINMTFTRNEETRRNQGLEGGFDLPERAFDRTQTDEVGRMLWTAVGSHAVNDVRVEVTRNRAGTDPRLSAPAVLVFDAFFAGGNQNAGTRSSSITTQGSNTLTLQRGRHTAKAGVLFETINQDSTDRTGFNGQFLFGTDMERDANGNGILNEAGQPTLISPIENYRRTVAGLPGYAPSEYRITRGTPDVGVDQWSLGWFALDDWSVSNRLSLSYGVRQDFQNNVSQRFMRAAARGVVVAGRRERQERDQDWRGRVRRTRGAGHHARHAQGERHRSAAADLRAAVGIPSRRRRRSIRRRAGAVGGLHEGRRSADAVCGDRDDQLRASAAVGAVRGGAVYLHEGRAPAAAAQHQRAGPWRGGHARARGRGGRADAAVRIDRTIPAAAGDGRPARTHQEGADVLRQLHVGQEGERYRQSVHDAREFERSRRWTTAPRRTISGITFVAGATVEFPIKLYITPSLSIASGRPFNITTGADNNGDTIFADRPAFAAPGEVGHSHRVRPARSESVAGRPDHPAQLRARARGRSR